MKHEQITLYKIWDSIYDIGNEDLRKIMDSIGQRPSIDMRFDMLIQKLSRANPILGNLVKLSREKRIPLHAFYQIFTNGKMLNVGNIQTDVDPNVSYLLPAKLDAIMESIINIATKYDTPELQSIITNLKWFYKNPINGTLQCKYEIFNIIANNSHITMYIDGTVKLPKNGDALGITWGHSNGFETLKIPMDTKKKYHITTDELSDIIRLFVTVVELEQMRSTLDVFLSAIRNPMQSLSTMIKLDQSPNNNSESKTIELSTDTESDTDVGHCTITIEHTEKNNLSIISVYTFGITI